MWDRELYIQAIRTEPKQPVNLLRLLREWLWDNFYFNMYCAQWAAAAAALCSFLFLPRGVSQVCDWDSLLHCEPSSH